MSTDTESLEDENELSMNRRSSMTLLSDPVGHYSHRVRIVLAEKGVTCEIVDTDAKSLSRELIDVNPYSSLPTLLDRDLVLYESKVIMEYLDERFPHPPLLPVYPVTRGESRLLLYRIERDWCSLVDTIEAGRAKNIDKYRKDLADGLLSVAPIFLEKPYFMNEDFTLVDCCLAPVLWRLKHLGVKIPNTKQSKPLRDYMKRLFERESFQQSLTDLERELM